MYCKELTSEITPDAFDDYDKIVVDYRLFDKKNGMKRIRLNTYRYDNDRNTGLIKTRVKEWQHDKFKFDREEEDYLKISLKDMLNKINEKINSLSYYPMIDDDIYISLKVIGYGVPNDKMQGMKTKVSKYCSPMQYLENSVRNML